MTDSPLSSGNSGPRSSRITGPRVAVLVVGWLAVASLAAPSLDLYYEARASLFLAPPLVLTYVYCLSHPRRATALLAVLATVAAVLTIGFVLLIPKAASA